MQPSSVFKKILLIIFLLTFNSYSQTTYTWIGANNASWATASNWSPTRTTPNTTDILQFNSGTTRTITAVPTQTIGRFVMSGNTTITLQSSSAQTLTTGNGSGTDLDIPAGSSLTIGGANALTITLASNSTANVSGTLSINSVAIYNTNGTTVVTTVDGSIVNSGTVNTGLFGGAKLVFSAGSSYQHSQNGGVVPTSTWNSNSTCLITGTTTTNPTGIGQSFANFSWNCPGQSINTTLGLLFSISGNFTTNNTGSGSIQLFPGLGTTTIPGNYSQTGGSFWLAPALTRTLTVGGNFSLSGGTFIMSSAGVIGTLNVAGNFSHTAGTIDETSTGSGLIIFNGTTNQTYSGGGTISNTINFTINNPAGITLLTSVTFPSTLTLSSGNITTGSNTLSLGTSTSNLGTLVRTSGSIIGNFRRWFAAGTVSNALFPIGTSTNYRPANISFTGAITTGGTLTTFFTSSNPGTAGLPLNDGGTSIINPGQDGYWTINSGNGLTGGTYTLNLTANGFGGVSNYSTLEF